MFKKFKPKKLIKKTIAVKDELKEMAHHLRDHFSHKKLTPVHVVIGKSRRHR